MGFTTAYGVYEENTLVAITGSEDLALSIMRLILDRGMTVDARVRLVQLSIAFDLDEIIDKDKHRYDEPREVTTLDQKRNKSEGSSGV